MSSILEEQEATILAFLSGNASHTGLENKSIDDIEAPEIGKEEFYWDFQTKASKFVFDWLYIKNNPSIVLRGGVGVGKTFVLKRILQYIFKTKVLDGKSLCPYPVFCVTAANVIEQTKRVFKAGRLDLNRQVLVTNYDQLRATWGGRYIDEIIQVQSGIEYVMYKWKLMHPLLIVWDECQKLKNEQSQQSKIGQAANEIKHPMFKQIFCSATPFTKVCEAKCIAVSTKIDLGYDED